MRTLIACFAFLGVCLVATAATDDDAEHRERNPLDQGADWCPATVIASAPFIDFGTTTGQNNDWNPSCAQCCEGEDVIYEFTPSFTTQYRISLCLIATFDNVLEIRTGGSCPGDTQVACSDDACGSQAQVDMVMNAGTTYYIIVDGYFESDGSYALQLLPFGMGAEGCPSTVIPSLPYMDIGTTLYRTDDFSFCSGSPAPDAIYEFTAPVTADYTFSLCGSSYNTRLSLNTGGSCPGNTQIYCGDNGCTFTLSTEFTTTLWGSLTYYIIVDGASGESGNYVLNVSRETSCDTCEADSCPATLIPSLPYTDNGTTVGMTDDFTSYWCDGDEAPDVIYRLTVPTTQNIVAKLTNEPGPHLRDLHIRSGQTCPGENVVCTFGSNGIGASITWQALGGEQYYIVVDDQSSGSGPYTLSVFPVCEVTAQPGDIQECQETIGPDHQGDDCNGGCNNVSWGGDPNFADYTCGQTVFGRMFTYDGTQPLSDEDWYRFTLTQPCSLAMNVSSEFPWKIFVKPSTCEPTYYHFYTGSACSTLTRIETGSPHHILQAGSYDLWIESQQDTAMPDPLHYRLRVDCFAVCGEDGSIATLPGSYSSNTCGEGDDCTLDMQQQVETQDRLVRVDIPEQGNYTFSLCSSVEPWTSFMSLMSSCCDNPVIIAQSDGGCPGNGLAQLDCIALEAGPVFVLVENDGNEGPPFCTEDFTLTVTPCPCPEIDSLAITPFEEFSVFLSFYVPEPGLVKVYYSTNAAQEYPTGFVLVDQYPANAAGRVDFYEIAAPDLSGRFVLTLDDCGF